MGSLRKIIFILCAVSSLAVMGQDLPQAFRASYDLESKGEYAQAAMILKNVYDKDSYEINLRLGWLSYLSGAFTESVSYYNKAIVLKPYSIEPRFGVVLPLSAMGNQEAVLSQYNKILEVDPRNTMANYRVGSIYYYAEDYETALKYFEKVVNLYPFDYDGLILYAWTHLKLGKQREAEVLFRKALLNNPGDASATEGLSLIK